MPELPEVETIARQLRARGIEGCEICSVRVSWVPMIAPFSVADFSAQLCGTRIEKISRVGKWLLFLLSSGQTVLVHLRMAGSFSLEPSAYDRVVLELTDGRMLCYRDTRKFGRWKLVDDPAEILDSLGPDALTPEFTLDYFAAALSHRTRMIKPLILDQSIVAGLGNIYADEALWEAQIHPEQRADSLSENELRRLFESIQKVLELGVKNRGTSLGDGKTNYRDVAGLAGNNRGAVKAYGRAGQPCARCGTVLEKRIVAQRGTTFCPRCQLIG
jgi:formamidopyrimidine-DNA glycosylase